jgi:tetratricopeptide (TPR) repeat protein
MKKWIYVFMMVALVGCGKTEKAEDKFEGVAVSQNGRDFISEGFRHLQAGNIQQAINNFDEAIKNDPANPEKYLVLGEVYVRLKNFERAEDTLAAALRVAPNNGDVYYLLGLARAFQGKNELAVEAAKKSVEIFVQDRDEEKFKKAVAMLKGLTEAQQPQSASVQ